jgi:hypothetical protein
MLNHQFTTPDAFSLKWHKLRLNISGNPVIQIFAKKNEVSNLQNITFKI